MNSVRHSLVAVLLLVVAGGWNGENLHAQTIIDDLQSQTDPSDGVITIECDSTLMELIGQPGALSDANGHSGIIDRSGYRIQVFMGNGNDPGARPEATSKQAAIRNAFPELPAYLVFVAPNWRLLVGDFMTREEAHTVMQRLQREFPHFGKEMYIISDKIRLPVER
ncbi:MAG: SPOR domain-containing protein [Dysgonamonadaceae bacterium]|jgi:hypothetical protein|nr:SPOR domain-containing protein [Dysgonamonadaceae bacterium]